MKKLQHQISCVAKTNQNQYTQPQSPNLLTKTEQLPNLRQSDVKALQGKVLLIQERNKAIQQFYEQKVAQLKMVLAKQNETKEDLIHQLGRLSIESHKQNRYIMELKNKMEEDMTGCSTKSIKQSVELGPSIENSFEKGFNRRVSKSKGDKLFSSNKFGVGSNYKIFLKKSKSQEFLQCQYFMKERDSKKDRLNFGFNVQNGRRD